MSARPTVAPRDDNFVPMPLVAVGIVSSRQTNTTTATAVQLITVATPCRAVEVSAYSSNVSAISIGSATAKAQGTAASLSGTGRQMLSGTSDIFYVVDASYLYVAVSTVNDGVSFNIYT